MPTCLIPGTANEPGQERLARVIRGSVLDDSKPERLADVIHVLGAGWCEFGYELMDRQDRFVGYNDFTRDTYSFEFHWSPGRRFDLETNAYYRIYDYPNAFAFNNPVAGPKTLESVDGTLLATWRMTTRLKLVAEIVYRETASTDTRIEYDRTRYSLGLVWEQ